MYGHKGVLSREGGDEVVDVVCVFASLGCDEYV